MYNLPTFVYVCGHKYYIRNNADFKTILRCIAACQDEDITEIERTISALIIFYECLKEPEDIFYFFDDVQEAVKEMTSFISVGNEAVGYQAQHKLIDWVQDEKLIVSAVNSVAKTEIRALPYLHWWTFIAHYMAIGECPLSMIVGIRDKIAKGIKLEKHEQEFRRQNPHYFSWRTKNIKRIEQQIDDMWNNS